MRAAVAVIILSCSLLGTFSSALAASRLPVKVQLVLVKASKQMEKEEYGAAVVLLNEFRSRSGQDEGSIYEHPAINITLGNCLSLMERFDEAAAAYRRAIQREQDSVVAWQNLGRCAYELKNFQEASRCFHKAYTLSDPPHAELLYQAAVTMLMAEQYKQSIALFEHLLKTHPQEMQLAWKENLVYALLAVDRNQQALPSISELAEGYTGKKQRQWREILLQQYLVLHMYAQARDLATRLTRLEPDEPLWWKSLAHIYLQQGKLEPALQSLIIYRFLIPLTMEEKKLVADLHLQLGVPVKAVGDYESYLETKPDREIIRRLVHAYMALGEMETALKRLEQFDPKEKRADLSMLKGEILYGLRRYGEATSAFSQAAAGGEEKSAGRALLMLAYCHWQQQEVRASIAAFSKAADYKRYQREAEQAIAQLTKILEQQKQLAGQGL